MTMEFPISNSMEKNFKTKKKITRLTKYCGENFSKAYFLIREEIAIQALGACMALAINLMPPVQH